jgi:hypothetical protein
MLDYELRYLRSIAFISALKQHQCPDISKRIGYVQLELYGKANPPSPDFVDICIAIVEAK